MKNSAHVEMLVRAAKVRSFIGKHPMCSFRDIYVAFFPMKVTSLMKFLQGRGYINRRFHSGGWRYEVVPIGNQLVYTGENHEQDDTASEEVPISGEPEV